MNASLFVKSCALFVCLILPAAYGEALCSEKDGCDVNLAESTGDLHMLQANAKKVVIKRHEPDPIVLGQPYNITQRFRSLLEKQLGKFQSNGNVNEGKVRAHYISWLVLVVDAIILLSCFVVFLKFEYTSQQEKSETLSAVEEFSKAQRTSDDGKMRLDMLDNARCIASTAVLLGHMITHGILGPCAIVHGMRDSLQSATDPPSPLRIQTETLVGLQKWMVNWDIHLFALLSGCLSRDLVGARAGSLIINLVIPLLTFHYIQSMVTLLYDEHPEQLVDGISVALQASAWYLEAVLIWRLLFPLFSNIRPLAALLVAFTLSAFQQQFFPGVLKVSDDESGIGVGRSIAYLPCFVVGMMCNAKYARCLMHYKCRLAAAMFLGCNMYIHLMHPAWVEALFITGSMRDPFPACTTTPGLYPAVSLEYVDLCKHVDPDLAWGHKLLWLFNGLAMALSVLALSPARPVPVMTEAGTKTIYNYLLADIVVVLPLERAGFGSLLARLPFLLRPAVGVMLALATNALVTSKMSQKTFGLFIEPAWLKPYLLPDTVKG